MQKQIDDVDAQQTLALDFGAQQEFYVSQTGSDKAARKDKSKEEAHVGAEEPVQGREGLRYSFMEQNTTEELARMDAAGETEEYPRQWSATI